jgi:hypothetical protein
VFRTVRGLIVVAGVVDVAVDGAGAVAVGEVTKGVVQRRRRDPAGADQLARWLSGLRQLFVERILIVGTKSPPAGVSWRPAPCSARCRSSSSSTRSRAL